MSQPDQSADLAKKSRELAEKERVLNARENILEREKAVQQRQKVFSDAETKLEVLRKQVTAQEEILESRKLEVTKLAEGAESSLESLRAQRQVVEQAIKVQNNKLAESARKDSLLNSSLRSKQSELSSLKEQIKETKEYRNEQERLSETTIGEWNITLQEFRKEADNIQSDKNRLSADIIHLGQDKMALRDEKHRIEAKLDVLEKGYFTKVDEFKDKLRELSVEVDQKVVELDTLKNTQSMREQALNAKERSLHIKEGTFIKRDLELDQKERRLRGAYGMASIPWDGV